MDKLVTLSEVFKKAQDCFTPTFNAVQFESDVDSLSKGETENLLGTIQAEILKGGDYDTLTEMRSIALDHIADIEKAVYADNAQNRKLGRVGQEYGGKGSRGGKTGDEGGLGSNSAKKVANLMADNSRFAARIEVLIDKHLGKELEKKYGSSDFADIFDKVGEDNYDAWMTKTIRRLPKSEVMAAYNEYAGKK